MGASASNGEGAGGAVVLMTGRANASVGGGAPGAGVPEGGGGAPPTGGAVGSIPSGRGASGVPGVGPGITGGGGVSGGKAPLGTAVVIFNGKPVKPVCAPVFSVRKREFNPGLFVSPPPLNSGACEPGPPNPGISPNGKKALLNGKVKGILIRKDPVFFCVLSIERKGLNLARS